MYERFHLADRFVHASNVLHDRSRYIVRIKPTRDIPKTEFFSSLLGLVFVALLITFVTCAYRIQNQNFEKDLENRVAGASRLFHIQLEEDAGLMSAAIEVLKRDVRYQAAWQAKDRAALLKLATPLFERLRDEHRVTHFYFHDSDRVNFLRVHKPGRHSDLINRSTMKQAAETGEPAHGIELGPLGTLALRVVHPWRVDGQLVGYLELGEEIEHITKHLRDVVDVEVMVFIRKEFLTRKDWGRRMNMLGREGNWEQFANVALADTTMDRIPQELGPHLLERLHDDASSSGDREIDGWRVGLGSMELVDAGGRNVGEVVFWHDVTGPRSELFDQIRMLTTVCVMVGLVLVTLFYFILGRAERELATLNQLREAMNAAQAATHAKSEFLANMSHEIRTPMTAILGFAETLLDADQSESERLNAVQTIRRNGDHLLGVINDILDLSKIEAGKMVAERVACHPCRIIAEAASLVRVHSDPKGLPLNIEYVGTIPETIQSDPTRLRQILINLLGNAIKFTRVGAVRLVTRVVNDADEPRLQFDLIDTGRGMTEAHVARLFQPFTQADTSTTRKFGGTGLGLTISKQFAELLGGDITVVQTKVGIGTTFRLTVATGTLDSVKMLEHPMMATVTADADEPVERANLEGCRILLAEDGPDNQRLICFVLKKAGANVTVEENGELAVNAALAARDEGNPFDCILMDMQMPVMDGYKSTGVLRSEGYASPIIALTAHTMVDDRQKCIDAGCDDYATKPIDRTKLIETIDTCVKGAAVSHLGAHSR